MKMTIKVNNQQVLKKLNFLSNGLNNANVPLQELAVDLKNHFKEEVFDSEGKQGSGAWKSLSPVTVLARAQGWGHYKNKPITTNKTLTWTGKLRNSFKSVVNLGKTLVISNTAPYYPDHQSGKGRIPRRQILGVDKVVQDKTKNVFTKYFNKLIK